MFGLFVLLFIGAAGAFCGWLLICLFEVLFWLKSGAWAGWTLAGITGATPASSDLKGVDLLINALLFKPAAETLLILAVVLLVGAVVAFVIAHS